MTKDSANIDRILIVGSGAVGIYYGSRLAQAGHNVTFLLRSDFDAVQKNGFQIESVDGDFTIQAPQIIRSTDGQAPFDLIIVAWKATSDDHFREVLQPVTDAGTAILSLQNGMSSIDRLVELYGHDRVLGGLCFVCLNRIAHGHVRHTAGGVVTIAESSGPATPRTRAISAAFQSAKITSATGDSLEELQWKKLVWNVPFNGLTIIHGGIDTRELLELEGGESHVRALMAEVIAAAAARGHQIAPEAIDQQIKRTRGMADYKPSSMLDYINGHPVEIEAIWAAPLKKAIAAGAELPHWQTLLHDLERCISKRDARA